MANFLILDMISMYLRENQYHVLHPQNGIEGPMLFNIQLDTVALTITDIMEVALLTVIKEKKSNVQIIAFSGFREHPLSLA